MTKLPRSLYLLLLPPALFALSALIHPTAALAQANVAPGFVPDRTALLRGVGTVQSPGALAGTLTLLDDSRAFSVIDGERSGDRVAVVAGARAGRGRVVVYGHDGFLGRATLQLTGAARLLTNAAAWAGTARRAGKSRVLLLGQPEVRATLEAAGFAVTDVARGSVAGALPNSDVVIVNPETLDGTAGLAATAEIQAWVRGGGGLITYGVGWGWQQLHPGKSLAADAPFNRLLVPLAGIGCDGGTVGDVGQSFKADESLPSAGGAGAALALLTRYASGTATLTPAQAASAGHALISALDVLPDNDVTFLPGVRALLSKYGTGPSGSVTPTKYSIITDAQPIARIAAAFEARKRAGLPAAQITAHPAAAAFPGLVPADAPRLVGEVRPIDLSVPDWHGTGLYAAPGETITVTVPADAARAGLGIRIGAHTDRLWEVNSWSRFPDISVEKKIAGVTLQLANAFGGTIYVTVPETGAKTGVVPVTISGGVAQPYFVKGVTNATDWNARIRNAPAPWTELQGDNIILTVPSFAVRNLRDPEALMTYWDQVADAAADLYGIPRRRLRPERYCVDIQISAGYMHSGYPIMTFDDVAATFVNLRVLRGSDGLKTWGFYHELGHNHQRPDWTWEGMGEVTNNLLSLYGDETFNGVKPDYINSHPAIAPDARHQRLVRYLAGGASFSGLNSDPFLTLTMFIQLRQTFGWEPFKTVFHEYTTLGDGERPKSETDKHDQFMVRFSKAVGKDLGPFFTAWGLPTSAAARAQLAGLPTWSAPDWPLPAEVVAAKARL